MKTNNKPLQTRNAKNPSLNISPPPGGGGLVLENCAQIQSKTRTTFKIGYSGLTACVTICFPWHDMTGRQSYRSRLILFADYLFGPPTFEYQKFNSLLPRIFQILDKVDSVIQVHGTSSQPWHKEIFAWMHISRLIGFLLECEFNHVKREKCEKIDKKLKTLLVLESFLFALFQRKEKDPRAEAEVCICACSVASWQVESWSSNHVWKSA